MVELNRPRRLEVDYVLETRDGDWVGVEVKLGPMALADCFAVALAASVGGRAFERGSRDHRPGGASSLRGSGPAVALAGWRRPAGIVTLSGPFLGLLLEHEACLEGDQRLRPNHRLRRMELAPSERTAR